MKDKIVTLVIGILIGAIITAGGFLIFGNNNSNNGMQGGPDSSQMGEKPSGEMGDGQGTPPDAGNSNATSTSTNTTAE